MFPGSSCCTWTETNGSIFLCVWALWILSQYLGKKRLTFLSFHCYLHQHMSPIRYKTVSMSVDMLAILDELSGAPYSIYPRSIETTIPMTNKFRQQKQKRKKKFWVSKLYGCKFPGSPCCTQTETDGNARCFTYYFVFQYASITNHTGMYKTNTIKE